MTVRGLVHQFSSNSIVLSCVLVVTVCTVVAASVSSLSSTRVEAAEPAFVHPGVLVNKAQLSTTRVKISQNKQPWTTALARAQQSAPGQATYQPQAYSVVICSVGTPDHPSCQAEVDDALAAYTQALLWNYTNNRAHARAAIRILNAWGTKLQYHTSQLDGSPDPAGATGVAGVYGNASWAGDLFARAAELTRYTGAGWSSADAAKFQAMLRRAFLPKLTDEAQVGANMRFSIASANTGIGVFLDDRAVFNLGVEQWRRSVPSTIYLNSDGAKPPKPINNPSGRNLQWCWNTTAECEAYAESLGVAYGGRAVLSKYSEGIQAETCRDAGHLSMGIASMFDTAETAYIQGLDLYNEQRARLIAVMEYNTRMLRYNQGQLSNGSTRPSGWVCPPFSSSTSWGTTTVKPTSNTWDIAYNHFRGRLGVNLPNTAAYLQEVTASDRRPQKSAKLMQAWETLTHGYN
ncbi:MAG: alginate lyase family protein [Candidatus Saccharimonadales bacterium]